MPIGRLVASLTQAASIRTIWPKLTGRPFEEPSGPLVPVLVHGQSEAAACRAVDSEVLLDGLTAYSEMAKIAR